MPVRLRHVATAVTAAVVVGCSTDPRPEGQASPGGAVSAAGLVTTGARSQAGVRSSPVRHVPGELLVRFRRPASLAAQASTHRKLGTRVVREFRSPRGLQLVRLPSGRTLRDALETFRKDPGVLYAEPNYVVSAAATPNDPQYPLLWGLHNTGQTNGLVDADIDAPEAWDLTTGGRDAVVAVIDSGVDYTHPDLAANVYSNAADCDGDGADDDGNGFADDCHGIDVVNHDSDPMDDLGHGTFVAGIIGAVGNDGAGVAGVSWAASLLACKSLDAMGEGSTADAIACLDYVAMMKDRGVNIVATNDSWGGGFFSQALADAIDGQRQRGILFVASAGNYGDDVDVSGISYPCGLSAPNLICVGASDASDALASFSNRGRRTVHLVAPGVDIVSTIPGGGLAYLDGTSTAAPHVVGTVALVRALHPDADWRELKNRVLASGDLLGEPLPLVTVTGRRLNAYQALTCAQSVVAERLLPVRSDLTVAAGAVIELAALNIDCATPNGAVTVTVSPGGVQVVLQDDGAGADVAAGDGVYSGTWTASAGGDFSLAFPGPDYVHVRVDPDLQTGFPCRTWFDAGAYPGGAVIHALVGNIDAEPSLEIVTSGISEGPLWAFEADGTVVPGWPVIDHGVGVAYPSLGKLSDAAGMQVVASYYDDGAAVAYDGAGAVLSGWPIPEAPGVQRPPLVADVDDDGRGEVFLGSGAFRSDGQPLQGTPGTGVNPPVVADLDGDGTLELLYVSEPVSGIVELRVLRLDGAPVAGFPVSFFGTVDIYPAVADLDADGEREIVVAGGATSPSGGVLIFGADGTLERELAVPAWGAPALTDLEGDGVPELVIQSDAGVSVVRGQGDPLPGWPVDPVGESQGNSSPVVGDLDGDGRPDVAFTTHVTGSATDGYVHVYGPDGVPHPRFPKALPLGSGGTPAIADIDLDGRNELVVTGTFWNGTPGFYDKVWAYDLGGSTPGAVAWGQLMGNAQHTGTASPPSFHGLAVSTTGSGSVTSVPAGIDCGAACQARFLGGTAVALTATAADGQVFAGWTGACAGQPATCQVTVSSELAIEAAFDVPPPPEPPPTPSSGGCGCAAGPDGSPEVALLLMLTGGVWAGGARRSLRRRPAGT